MVRYTNECVRCGLPCLFDACPNYHVAHYSCDECGQSFSPEELYNIDGDELCIDCAVKRINGGALPSDSKKRYKLEDEVLEKYSSLC